jgi:hypothetical protein
MQFKDLKSGDKFICECAVNDGKDAYLSTTIFIKLRLPLVDAATIKIALKHDFKGIITAIDLGGDVACIDDNAEVIRLK